MIKRFFPATYDIIKKSYLSFSENDPITLAGALAFYTIFAIPPMFIIIINGVGVFAGKELASQELFYQINELWGSRAANLIQTMIKNYTIARQSLFHQVIGILTLLFAASSFFAVIQHSLNKIWRVKPKPWSSVLNVLKNRVLSFGIILVLSIMLLLSVLLDSFLLLMQNQVATLLPGITPLLFGVLGFMLSFVLVTLILAIIYKFLPDASVDWDVVWVGATVTAILFSLGKLVIGFMLANSNIQDVYGIVGALIGVLLWVYYSAIILFFGAEITQQYAISFSRPIRPREYAVKIVTKEIYRTEEKNSS